MSTEIVKVNNTDIECPYENEQNYVAIRSICRALGIDHQKQFERIKNDAMLREVYTDTVYTLDKKGVSQPMFCLPVKYVFGWIFTIDDTKVSDRARPAFLKYKQECYEALYEHFFLGSASRQRKDLLRRKAEIQAELANLQNKFSEDEDYKKLEALRAEQARIGKSLKELDQEQLDLFSSSGVELEE
jgi:hypothetical protein